MGYCYYKTSGGGVISGKHGDKMRDLQFPFEFNKLTQNTDRSKAVLLLWFLTVICSCCPY